MNLINKMSKKDEKFFEYYIDMQKDNNNSSIRESGKFSRLFTSMILGTLVLSVTFLVNIIKEYSLDFLPVFKFSLIYLAISLFFELLGYFAVQEHFNKRRECIKKWYEETIKNSKATKFMEENFWTKTAQLLDAIAFGFGISGLFWFSYFAYMLISYIEKLNSFTTCL